MAEQFKRLISNPLSSVQTRTIIVVVDALDECDGERDIETILQLWSRHLPARLKLLLTSRPETPIRVKFAEMPQCHQHVKLDHAPNIKDDLEVYIRYQFGEMCGVDRKPLGHDWINQDTVDCLVNLSFPLFIIAATICRFVRDPDWDPEEGLREILAHPSIGHLSNTERIYLPILTHVITKYQASDKRDILTKQFQAVLGTIVCLVEPLSASGLATLIDIPEKYVRLRLDPLHSVLSIPEDQAQIRVLHLSFPEFLLSQRSRGQPFGVDGPRMHATLTGYCMRLLSNLRQNPLNLPPAQLRADIEPGLIDSYFSPALRYACRYWVYHLKESQTRIDSRDFLRQHFLHWLEALSLIDCLSEAISFVETLIQVYPSDDFLEDARRFILANRYVIDLAPPQTYISAIIFAPQTSKVKATAQIPKWLLRYPQAPLQWGPELQKLQGYGGQIRFALSPDRSRLATASMATNTVHLWDIRTGREVQNFERDHPVMMVAFSPDSLELVLAHKWGMICIWDIRTGQGILRLDTKGHIREAALSPHGLLIAMPRNDDTICFWHIETGRGRVLTGHDDIIGQVAFSADGFSLASSSLDNTVRIWNVNTGQQTHVLRHKEETFSVAFSANDSLVASGTEFAVYIWDAITGHQVHTLQISHPVESLAFSPDAFLLACGSVEGAVTIRNIKTGQKTQTLSGHSSHVCGVVFSGDDVLVSASWDGTMRLWDVKSTPEEQITKNDQRYRYITFSPDGSLLASSGHDSIHLWDMQTGKMIQSQAAFLDHGQHILFSPNSSLLAWVPEEGIVGLWDVRTGMKNHIFKDPESQIYRIAVSPDTTSLAIATWRVDDTEIGTVHVRDIARDQELHKISIDSMVTGMSFSPADSLLAVADISGMVVIWDIGKCELAEPVYQVDAGEDMHGGVAVSQDGNLLAVCGWYYTKSIQLCVLKAEQQVQVSKGDFSNVRNMRFAYDDRSLITNCGIMSIDADTFHFRSHSIACPNNWIQSGDEKLVWLPGYYRGTCTDYHDGVIAIAQKGGGIGFWQLHHDQDFTV